MGRLADKTAIITGGTSGIGRDATLRFVSEGARVLFTGRNREGAEATLEQVAKLGGEAHFEPQDATLEDDWQRVMRVAGEKFGRLDILVNNAGMFFLKNIEDTTPEEFNRMWRINVDGVFLGTKYGAAAMEAAGGSIVNIASLSGLVGHELCSAYCSTKAGAVSLTRAAALELAPKIRVNAITPGPVWNELLERTHGADQAEAMKQFYVDTSPLKVLGDSSDVAHGIVYLASDEARFVTGVAFRIDAGRGAD